MSFSVLLETVWRDLRHSLRTLGKNPLFAATAILTLALAIGANTAMFTVIHAVLLNPLKYRDPEQLAMISQGASPTRFAEMKSAANSFSALGAFAGQENLTLARGSAPEVLAAARVSASFLAILGVDPLIGRGFLPQEDKPGGTAVALISAELWQRRFAGDARVIGKTAVLEGVPYVVIGVLPPHFAFPFRGVDVWLTRPEEWPPMAAKSRQLSPFLTIFGRLQPRVTVAQANAEMAVVHRQYAAAHPAMLDAKAKSTIEVTLMKDEVVSSIRTMLLMLFGAVCFVLLIACANVASLFLARAAGRSREFAVRFALGAARVRIAGQLLAESFLLAAAGGALGVFLAWMSVRAIPSITAFDLPRAAEIHLDWPVLAFAAVLSLGTAVLIGLTPALGASRPDLMHVLRARGETVSQGVPARLLGRVSVRGVLVVTQVALSVVLLIGAALLMKSVVRLRHFDVGFNPSNLLTLRVSLPPARYGTEQKRAEFFERLVQGAESSPGVRSATAAMFLPMTGFVGSPVQDAGKPPLKVNERPIATLLVVAPNYFHTLEIPLRRGRDFNERDRDGAQRVALIDESFARHFWPAYPNGLDPVGQQLLIGGVNAKPVEIIGIVADAHQNLENTGWPLTAYVAFAQNAQQFAMPAVRTAGDPLRFANAMREQVRALDRDQAVSDVRTMDSLVDEELGQRRTTVALLGSFAGAALFLALIGLYGVIAYSVVQRTHEIGIRRALGAERGNVLGLVVRQGLGLALAGVTLGVVAAFGLTRVLAHLLFQVSATDPSTFVAIAVLFVVVALAASYIPARRAAAIDPLTALRTE